MSTAFLQIIAAVVELAILIYFMAIAWNIAASLRKIANRKE